MSDLLGDGIFTVDGEKWRHQRKPSSFEFCTKMLRDYSSGVFKRNAVKLALIVLQAASSNQAMEIQDNFMKSTLDCVFKVVLGVELDSMCGTSEEGTCFSNAFDEAGIMILYRYVDIFWKIKRNIGSEAVLRNKIEVMDKYVYKDINSKIQQVHKSQDDLPVNTHECQIKKGDLLSRFLELKKTDPEYLKDIILCLIIAGKDNGFNSFMVPLHGLQASSNTGIDCTGSERSYKVEE